MSSPGSWRSGRYDGATSPGPGQRPPGTSARAGRLPSGRSAERRAAPAADPTPESSGRTAAIARLSSRAAASTAKAGQPDRDLAEQCGDRVLAIVLHVANARATPAPRPPDGVVPGLRGDNLPLDARQHQLRFGQGQTQIGDVDEAIGTADLHHVRAPLLAFSPDFHQPQNPSHASTLGQRTSAEIPDRRRTPNLATVPRATGC